MSFAINFIIKLYFYILSKTQMLRNDYFHGFFKDHSLSFSQIDDDSLLSVIQIFVNEFWMSFGQNLHFQIDMTPF